VVKTMSKAEKYVLKTKKKSTFHEDLKNKDRLFVLFYATWCPFSQQFLPVFEEYSKSNPEGCLSIIAEEEPEVFEEYAIEYYPTVIMFKKGKVQHRLDSKPGIGLTKTQLKDLTEKQ
jgi:thiol-disulfide isomerase/thioredoxin